MSFVELLGLVGGYLLLLRVLLVQFGEFVPESVVHVDVVDVVVVLNLLIKDEVRKSIDTKLGAHADEALIELEKHDRGKVLT